MGGSMYERRDNIPHHPSLRERMLAELEAFGFYAARTNTEGIEPNNVSTPMPRTGLGETVITRFTITSGPGAGAEAAECLATFKPDRPGPHHASFLIAALADELSKFARTRGSSDFAATARSISTARGTARSVSVDDHPGLGWALLAKGATGLVVEHRDRILMWLGTDDRTVIPEAIYTDNNMGRLKMSGGVI